MIRILVLTCSPYWASYIHHLLLKVWEIIHILSGRLSLCKQRECLLGLNIILIYFPRSTFFCSTTLDISHILFCFVWYFPWFSSVEWGAKLVNYLVFFFFFFCFYVFIPMIYKTLGLLLWIVTMKSTITQCLSSWERERLKNMANSWIAASWKCHFGT